MCQALGMLDLIIEKVKEPVATAKKSYQSLVEIWWDYDPLRCTNCGGQMELVRIWKPNKGFVFDIFRNLFGNDIGPPGNLPAFLLREA